MTRYIRAAPARSKQPLIATVRDGRPLASRPDSPYTMGVPATQRSIIAALALCSACALNAPPQAEPAPPPDRQAEVSDYEQLLAVASSHLRSGRSEPGVEAAARAASLAPQRPEAFVLWGRALAQRDALEEAAARYESARALGSRDAALFAELASVYDVTKQYDRALAVYEDYLSDHPDDGEMQQQYGLTLLLQGRYDEAVAPLQRAVQAAPKAGQLRQDLGYALLSAGRAGEAIEAFTEVTKIAPGRAETMRLLAQAYAADGQAEAALGWLNKALQVDASDLRALHLRGRLKALTGDTGGAVADYQQLAARVEDPRRAWEELLGLGQKTGDRALMAAAQEQLTRAAGGKSPRGGAGPQK